MISSLLPNGTPPRRHRNIHVRHETKRAKVVQPLLLLTVLANPGYLPERKPTNPAATLATGGAQLGLTELIALDAEALEVRLSALGQLFARSRIQPSQSTPSRDGEPAFTKAELCVLFAELIEVLRIFGVVSNRVSPEAIAKAPREVVAHAWPHIRAVGEDHDALKQLAINVNADNEEGGDLKASAVVQSDLGKRGLLSKCPTATCLARSRSPSRASVRPCKRRSSTQASPPPPPERALPSSAMDKRNTDEAMATRQGQERGQGRSPGEPAAERARGEAQLSRDAASDD